MVTLAEIFRHHGPAYRGQFGNQMPPSHHRVMRAIERTASRDRFLQHVLPKGFCKVRYYGFFSAGQRQALQRVRQVLGVPVGSSEAQPETSEAQLRQPNIRCPACNRLMQRVSVLRQINPWREDDRNRSPPS